MKQTEIDEDGIADMSVRERSSRGRHDIPLVKTIEEIIEITLLRFASGRRLKLKELITALDRAEGLPLTDANFEKTKTKLRRLQIRR